MLKNIAISAVVATAIFLSSGTFAADAPVAADAAAAATTAVAAPANAKQQMKDLKMACKKDHKKDAAGYKDCVAQKKKDTAEKK